jgi:DNA-binding transcriptional LysR family regulator
MTTDLRQLRYFVAVAEEMHFGRAADRLHMTQPPLSQAIQSLESQLGTALFDRTRRSVALTAAGRALLPEARRLLQQASALKTLAMRAAAGESGQLSIAFVSSADYSVLPSSLREFRTAYPSVHIELQEATTDVQLNLLAENKLDLGILIPPLPDKLKIELSYLPIFSEPLMLAITEGSAISRLKGKIPLEACAEQPLIIFPRRIAPAFHDMILGCFRDAGLTPHIGQEAIQMQTIVGLVSAGMGIALVPQSVSNLKRPGVEYRAFKEASPRIEIGLAWRSDNDSPVLTAFINLMRKTHGC